MGKVIVVTSGKGGTGKTTCTGAIASCLSSLGYKTLCIDCDIGLRNLDLVLGLTDASVWDFSDIINERTSLEEAVIKHPEIENLFFLSAPSGLSPERIDNYDFKHLIDDLRGEYDYVLIDSPAGLGSGFRLASENADLALIVTTSDSSSLRDGQKTVAQLESLGIKNTRLIINRVRPEALKTIKATLDDVIDAVGAQLIGVVSEDDSVAVAANLEKPLIIFGAKYAYDQFVRIAKRISGERVSLKRV